MRDPAKMLQMMGCFLVFAFLGLFVLAILTSLGGSEERHFFQAAAFTALVVSVVSTEAGRLHRSHAEVLRRLERLERWVEWLEERVTACETGKPG